MKRHWEPHELIEDWTLLPAELELLANKTGATRLGFALLLKYFQIEGRFPQSKHDIPKAVLPHVARQVGVPADQYLAYDWRGRSIKAHRAQIRAWVGFREATVEDAEQLVSWLCNEVLPHERHPETLKAAMYQHCRDRHIEPPTPDRLERHLRTALHRFEDRLCAHVFDRLSPEIRTGLDALLHPPQNDLPDADEATESGRAVLHTLKADPGRVGLESVLSEIAKLQRLRQFDLAPDLFPPVAPKVLATYRQRAAAEAIHELRRHPDPLRMTLLASFCVLRSQEITDSLVELLMDVIQRIGVRAERKVEQALITDLKRVAGKQGILFDVAEAAVAHPDGSVREVIYPAAGGEQTLHDLVREAKAQGRTYRQQVHTVMRASYSNHYRRMVPRILAVLEFRSNNDLHRPLIRALELLKRYASSTQLYYAASEDVPLDGVVRTVWRDLVVKRDKDGMERVNRINYELCVLQTLREQLRCKELWVVGASRFRNPDDDLPTDFSTQRDTYYAALSQPRNADAFIAKLQQELMAALEALNKELPANPHVKILRKPKGHIKVAPLDPQPESVNVKRVKDQIGEAWANTNLLDILKETDLRVGWSEAFKSATAWENLDRATLQKRLLLCLFGLGTNTGLKRISAGGHGESYKDLLYVRRRFVHKEHLRLAISQVANAIFRIRQPHIWGEGTTVCASDSKKFGAWDQNLMTEWHLRYHGRGIMIYWHVEKKATCIYSQVKSCSSSEVAAMMEGVLRHDTEMTVTKHMVDSHGQSEIAFAFS
ncbi:MAG: Tn3 family transposase, partial [Chloroflexota bacterium]|nr:Tn3 family transposase [Chloroflexota bacterium]